MSDGSIEEKQGKDVQMTNEQTINESTLASYAAQSQEHAAKVERYRQLLNDCPTWNDVIEMLKIEQQITEVKHDATFAL